MVLPETANMQQIGEAKCLVLDERAIDILLERIYGANIVTGSTTGLGYRRVQ
jgi:hypothetical protein